MVIANNKIIVRKSPVHGMGVFALQTIEEDEIIEISPILLLNQSDTEWIDKTKIYDYYFGWRNDRAAIALGFGSLINHSYDPNAFYTKDFDNDVLFFIARRRIREEEEIVVNYNGDPFDQSKVWFDKD